ncbi:glucuronate isomerase [Pilibacter termitis]|uniref:Uronate isomerase n=1 Tax=Pilibacter termitis TaxID=263852 RepID=A0A1T4K4V5_9ENTE|nr:glucuronate isomerase [Pilibacter termitis]SJZ37478.1 glucuronate isomerase [Pilibacter termitis]
MFLDENFLLENEWAIRLYHNYAKHQPIIDYHCHLEAKEIYENRMYENITRLWLNDNGLGDHYKWRLMRTNGEDEQFISGDGEDEEKFLAFARTLEKAIGNPIFEWSHLELRRYFGIEDVLTEKTAASVWQRVNEKVHTDDCRPQELLKKMNVKALCTTDDPADTLEYHQKLAEVYEEVQIKVLPTFRPDNAWSIQTSDYPNYIARLAKVSNREIQSFEELKTVLAQRVDFFHEVGGRLSDHGLNSFYFEQATSEELENIFDRAIKGETDFTASERAKFTTALQLHLMKHYVKKGWTMQLHLNAFRNDSTKMQREIGINVGGDSSGDQPAITEHLVKLLAVAEEENALPRMICYSLNPTDWLPLATALQSFQGGMVQRLTFGAAWWFNDTREGMITQLITMAQQSLLGNFVGMLTDSRSFLSYPRHEYFRRILCNLIGEWVNRGQVPEDEEFLGKIVADICYGNVSKQLGI